MRKVRNIRAEVRGGPVNTEDEYKYKYISEYKEPVRFNVSVFGFLSCG